jgi:hypothetical protein
MTDVKIELQVPKELNDVRVALVQLVKDVRAGHSVAQILANLGVFLEAVNGISEIPDEVKNELQGSLEVGALFASDVIGALLTPQI